MFWMKKKQTWKPLITQIEKVMKKIVLKREKIGLKLEDFT